jgi:hypothetical protein
MDIGKTAQEFAEHKASLAQDQGVGDLNTALLVWESMAIDVLTFVAARQRQE